VRRGNSRHCRVIKLSWKPRVIPLAYKPEADDPWQPNDHLGNAKKMKMSHLKTAGTSKPSNGMAKKIKSPRVRSPSPPLDRAASEDPIASMEIDDGEIQVAVSSRTRGNDKVGFKATRAESRRVCAAFGYTDEEVSNNRYAPSTDVS